MTSERCSMPRWIVASAAAALSIGIAAPIARAEGINLSWDDCGSFGVANKAFACDVNDAVFTLVASFIRDAPDSVLGIGGDLVFDAEPADFPDWWKFPDNNPLPNAPGACQDSAQIQFDDGQMTSCPTIVVDPEPQPTFAYVWFHQIGTQKQGVIAFATTSTSIMQGVIEPGVEYAYLRLIIRPTNTMGTDACTGCGTPLSIRLTRAVFIRFPGPNYEITQPATRSFVTWEGQPTPVLPATWGAVKRLYR
jgi:hypothetical protein